MGLFLRLQGWLIPAAVNYVLNS